MKFKSINKKYLILFAAALLLRVLYIYFPAFDYYAKSFPVSFSATEQYSDAKTYVELASGLLDKGYPASKGRLIMFSGYVYPFILAVFMKISDNLLPLFVFQAILSSLICIMIAKISNNIFKAELPGLISGYLWAVCYPAFIAISRSLTEIVFTFIFIYGIYYTVTRRKMENKAAFYIIIGVIFSAASLTRAILFYVFFLMAAVYLAYFFFEKRKIDYKVIFAIISFCLIQVPWSYLGYVHNDRLIIASTSGGGNLAIGTYIPGNGEFAAESFEQNPDHPINIVDKQYFEKNWSDAQRDSAYMEYGKKQLKDNFRNQPFAALKLMGYQISRFWLNVPYHHKSGIGNSINAVYTLILLGFMFIGYYKGRQKNKMICDMLMILIIVFCVLHSVTISIIRYSFPLLPVVYIFTGLGIYSVLERTGILKSKNEIEKT
ncbi:MAG: hypothetical protein PHN88_12345 [Ignavibacteria bacterium]|nr:hypothetical protein [Ignavibacteria bacterium]